MASSKVTGGSQLWNEAFLGKPSYTGVDVRVYARLYDGGRFLLNQTIKWQEEEHNLAQEINSSLDLRLNDQLKQERELVQKEITRLTFLSNESTISLIQLEELQTISISSFRDKVPVRALGAAYPKGYARGSRTLAGSMIFTTFDEHVLTKLLLAGTQNNDIDIHQGSVTTLADQLPPVDIQILFANEFGDQSIEVIYGLEFINDGHTISIEDLLLENTFQWVARDIDPMRRADEDRTTDFRSDTFNIAKGITGRQLLKQPNIQGYLARANPFDGNTI